MVWVGLGFVWDDLKLEIIRLNEMIIIFNMFFEIKNAIIYIYNVYMFVCIYIYMNCICLE